MKACTGELRIGGYEAASNGILLFGQDNREKLVLLLLHLGLY